MYIQGNLHIGVLALAVVVLAFYKVPLSLACGNHVDFVRDAAPFEHLSYFYLKPAPADNFTHEKLEGISRRTEIHYGLFQTVPGSRCRLFFAQQSVYLLIQFGGGDAVVQYRIELTGDFTDQFFRSAGPLQGIHHFFFRKGLHLAG